GQATQSGQATLPGTAPLAAENDPAADMVESIHAFLDRETAQSAGKRERFWKRDYASTEAHSRSLSANRERFRKIIGAVDARLPVTEMQLDATTSTPALVAEGNGFKVFAVRWPVLKGVTAEGLLLEPDGPPLARVVAIPDADWSPEMLAGLAPGVEPASQFARRLAENGCQVVVPALIDRRDTWSGIPSVKMTNQPHREFLYRMAFEVGRHIIGYETQKVLSAVDWFAHENARRKTPIAVAGYGEGGLLALYSAAIDERIAATLVSGYFQPRRKLWQEPIYRDVWELLREFGDAEIAGMIAPRTLVVEAARGPVVGGPPPQTNERKGAAPVGRLETPPLSEVEQEVARARVFYAGLRADDKLRLVRSDEGGGAPGSEAALATLTELIGMPKMKPMGSLPADQRGAFDPSPRLRRQFDDLVSYTQLLVRQSPARRAEFWSTADASSPERWKETTRFHRDYIWEEMIGRLPPPSLPVNPRTRLIYDEPTFRGYEVMLDVWPDVFAYGTLLVPKDLRPGERRPVVVCQHGLEGRPRDVADPKLDAPAYHRYAARLAEQGFITYAPQNPYIGEDRFRLIQRKAHPLKLALFSFILGQHERTLEWLSTLPFVDSRRIGFYGLSYGGKTAVRVPPLLDGYALSICSADFNEWVWKNTSVESPYSYLLTREYDMIEFDLANIANYAELASLMAPRPFMVERGHHDGVAPDEWVAYEFAKVRRFYARLGMPERTEIEFFNGPHTIHGVGTFEFLRRHLQWPVVSQK
ncbi:MAG: dienelactone hydrolase family protein, partial [Burkholderiales bacterium]